VYSRNSKCADYSLLVAMESMGGNETPGWKFEWDAISDAVWESLQVSGIFQEDEEESSDDMFFTPPESPDRLDPGFQEPCLCSIWGFQRFRVLTPTERLLHLHHTIVGQLIDAVYGSVDLLGCTVSFDSSLQEDMQKSLRFRGLLQEM
jgi:hypothetical protein